MEKPSINELILRRYFYGFSHGILVNTNPEDLLYYSYMFEDDTLLPDSECLLTEDNNIQINEIYG